MVPSLRGFPSDPLRQFLSSTLRLGCLPWWFWLKNLQGQHPNRRLLAMSPEPQGLADALRQQAASLAEGELLVSFLFFKLFLYFVVVFFQFSFCSCFCCFFIVVVSSFFCICFSLLVVVASTWREVTRTSALCRVFGLRGERGAPWPFRRPRLRGKRG